MSKYYEVTDGDLHVGYVSEEYVLKKFDERILTGKAECNFLIGEDEAVDVEPVKHGRWALVENGMGVHFVCPYCGEWRYHRRQKYCGECGAKLEEEYETH